MISYMFFILLKECFSTLRPKEQKDPVSKETRPITVFLILLCTAKSYYKKAATDHTAAAFLW